jgi:ribosomal protein S17E
MIHRDIYKLENSIKRFSLQKSKNIRNSIFGYMSRLEELMFLKLIKENYLT